MILKEDIRKILGTYKDESIIDEYISLESEIDDALLFYRKVIIPYAIQKYSLSAGGTFTTGQSRYWIVRGFDLEEANVLKKKTSSKYSSNSPKKIMEKYNVDENTAKQIIKERADKAKETTLNRYTANEIKNINLSKASKSLRKYIEKHGEVNGKILWENDSCKRKGTTSLAGFIDRYGDVEGVNRYNDYMDKMKKNYSLKESIKAYGTELGTKKYNESREKKSYSNTAQFYIDKYGDEIGNAKFLDRQRKWKQSCINSIEKMRSPNKTFKCSKEALSFFIPLYKCLRKNGIKRNEIYIGAGGLSEYIIGGTNISAYDFTIPLLNLAFEFHGRAFHPRSIDEDGWIHPYNKNGPDQYYTNDQNKIKKITEKGFTLITIWSDDNLVDARIRCLDVIINRITNLQKSQT